MTIKIHKHYLIKILLIFLICFANNFLNKFLNDFHDKLTLFFVLKFLYKIILNLLLDKSIFDLISTTYMFNLFSIKKLIDIYFLHSCLCIISFNFSFPKTPIKKEPIIICYYCNTFICCPKSLNSKFLIINVK